MNWNRIKKVVAGAGVVSALLLGAGGAFNTTAVAQNRDRGERQGRDERSGGQNWRRDGDRGSTQSRGWQQGGDRNWGRRDGDRDRDRNWDRGRGGYVYTYPRSYGGGYYGSPYGGYYGGSPYGGYYGGGYGGGGSFSAWEQRGYRDGLNRGREDASSGRYPTPNNSEHFRNGNAAYRQGFARGYQVGFGQYGGGYGRY